MAGCTTTLIPTADWLMLDGTLVGVQVPRYTPRSTRGGCSVRSPLEKNTDNTAPSTGVPQLSWMATSRSAGWKARRVKPSPGCLKTGTSVLQPEPARGSARAARSGSLLPVGAAPPPGGVTTATTVTVCRLLSVN